MNVMKKTDELGFELSNTKDIHKYIIENNAEFDSKKFTKFLKSLMEESRKTKSHIANESCLSEPYLYDILRNKKKPKRDSVIKLSFGLELDIPTTERLLMLAGHSQFYPRYMRDTLIYSARQKNMSIMEAEQLLAEYGCSLINEE
jgi:DNA-binding phage protein